MIHLAERVHPNVILLVLSFLELSCIAALNTGENSGAMIALVEVDDLTPVTQIKQTILVQELFQEWHLPLLFLDMGVGSVELLSQ